MKRTTLATVRLLVLVVIAAVATVARPHSTQVSGGTFQKRQTSGLFSIQP